MAIEYRTLEHAPEALINATVCMIVNEQFMTLRGMRGDERTLAFADLYGTASPPEWLLEDEAVLAALTARVRLQAKQDSGWFLEQLNALHRSAILD